VSIDTICIYLDQPRPPWSLPFRWLYDGIQPDSKTVSSSEHRSDNSSSATAPPTPNDTNRWKSHISLQQFGERLQASAKAVFPNVAKSRYSKISVLMLSWEDQDPSLPISIEVESWMSFSGTCKDFRRKYRKYQIRIVTRVKITGTRKDRMVK